MNEIMLSGTIVPNNDKWIYEYFEIDATCPADIRQALKAAAGQPVTIQVNSGGGDLVAGNEMYYLLATHEGTVTVDVIYAASAATVVCCGADCVRAIPSVQYMIHNVSATGSGDYRVMDHMSDLLKNANRTISNAYRLKTGMTENELLELMNRETYLDATKAKEYGFVDEIIGDNGVLATQINMYNSTAHILSEEVKQKIRNSVGNPGSQNQTADPDFLIATEKLNLLKMKGAIHYEIY